MTDPTPSDTRRIRFRRIADEAMEQSRLGGQMLEDLSRALASSAAYDARQSPSPALVRKILTRVRSLVNNRRAVTVEVGLRRFLIREFPIGESGNELKELHAQFRKAGIGGLTLLEGIEQKEMSDFLRHLGHLVVKNRDRGWLQDMMNMSGIARIRVKSPVTPSCGEKNAETDVASGSLVQDGRTRLGEKAITDPRRLYQAGVGLARELLSSAADPEPVDVREVDRIARNLVEMLEKKANGLVAMAIAGRIDAYPFLHPVNVAIFGVHMAATLFPERSRWVELARIGFLYDIGKGKVPAEIIYKKGPLDPEERKQLDRHSYDSAEMLDRLSDLDKQAVVVAYEHHLEKQSGEGERWEANLYTRIIRVAEAFDAMIGNNLYRRTVPPHKAMSTLLQEWKSMPEAPLLGRLIQGIGLFPAGSVVTLSSGEVGTVVRQNRKDLIHPEVQIVVDRTGRLLEVPEIRRTTGELFIDGVIPPDKVPFDPMEYFPF